MKPVTQTRFGHPGNDDALPGNCFPAAIASIMELPIEDVPWPDSKTDWSEYWDVLARWIAAYGYALVEIPIEPPQPFDAVYFWDSAAIVEGEQSPCYIANGDTVRGSRHSVVYQRGGLVHDPHPSGAGLETITGLTLLLPTRFERRIADEAAA